MICHVLSALTNQLALADQTLDRISFILAGDIVYQMAHDMPRFERSTGKPVTGSDIDLVVIVDDSFPPEILQRLDEAIYLEKLRLLLAPHIREEIDSIVKDLEKVREQCSFESFKQKVACKIMQEGIYLYGSERIFQIVKTLLEERGVIQKLEQIQRQAVTLRKQAESLLLTEDPDIINTHYPGLFYPADESDEFE